METAVRTARRDLALVEHPFVVARHRLPGRLAARPAWALTCLGLDVAMLGLAVGAVIVGNRFNSVAGFDAGWTLGFAVLALALLAAGGLYELGIGLRALDDVRRISVAVTLAAMIVVSARVFLGSPEFAAETIRPWAFALVYVAAGRIALYWSQTRARRDGSWMRPTLIVGAGRIGQLTAKRLLDHPELGLRPVAFLDKEPLSDPEQTLGIPVAGASWDFDAVVARHQLEHVIVTFSTAPDEVLLRLVRRCEERGIGVSVVPRLFEKVPERVEVDHLGGLPLVTGHSSDPGSWQFSVKYAFDRFVAAILLVLTLPVFAAAALAVRLSMGRQIFFRQVRVGRDGRTFECLKFRSMRPPADEATVPAALPEDTAPGGVEGADRRTRVGAFLRRTSIDELPQLLNVLRGEMSLVGPRPERPEFVAQFERSVYRYGDRHRVKAGITGWAQVHGLRGKTSIADRAEWDNFYIENFSLWLDLKILVMTLGAVFGYSGRVE
jgi:exopolysaccharide biosynthesis polyprenyl glycosylphosphotransferase